MNNPNKLPAVPMPEPINLELLIREGVGSLRELHEKGEINSDQVAEFLSHMAGFDKAKISLRRPQSESETL